MSIYLNTDTAFILELKVADNVKNLDKKCNEALK